ncbi:MAG: glycine cleavage system protein GcvH [Halobacteria archaeon]|nr:glycine cleavage system protein GcvH [Halobacteria archaeon]
MSFEVPEDLRYIETHEWIDPATGRVGITDFAQDELGDIVFVELPAEGDNVEKNAEFGIIESIKAVSDLYAPATGKVVDVNRELEAAPELVNDDPYGEGWLIEIEGEDENELDDLLSADEYREEIE